jgi:hypothetical protein
MAIRIIKFKLMKLCSYLPRFLIKLGNRLWPADPETFDGFWIDAHYEKWARKDKKITQH